MCIQTVIAPFLKTASGFLLRAVNLATTKKFSTRNWSIWQPVMAPLPPLPPLRVDFYSIWGARATCFGECGNKKIKGAPINFPPPSNASITPSLHLTYYEAMSRRRRESKEPKQVETSRSQRGVKRFNGLAQRALHKQWLTPTQATTFFNRWKAYTDCTQTAQAQSAHLESSHCANMGRGLPFLSRTCKPIDGQRKQTAAVSVFTHRPPSFFLSF